MSLAADDRVGTRFGEYQVDSLVGVGGMGKVYRAIAADGTAVALKLVKDDLARDETFRRRFRREARIAQTVKNPYVVAVRDTGEHDGTPYLAAEFIAGTTLDRKLELEGRLPLATTVRICQEIAHGLQALWEAGMVHRDVKPANILLDHAGKSYITDFGLAKVSDGTALTRPGQPMGSLDYMSPEQIRGEPVTGATDVYSLGCVVFECLLGRPPFGDREGMRVLWAHLQDEPPDPAAERSDISPALAQALLGALRKPPGERPPTSVEFARSLSRAAAIPTADPAA
ncbi:MAG TPA: serine/threonine-protein kinase [Solirubrobacteraceae bacterium]|nr:serine/threonine-protein kinase [Solirubrobacteraceae bacterium]